MKHRHRACDRVGVLESFIEVKKLSSGAHLCWYTGVSRSFDPELGSGSMVRDWAEGETGSSSMAGWLGVGNQSLQPPCINCLGFYCGFCFVFENGRIWPDCEGSSGTGLSPSPKEANCFLDVHLEAKEWGTAGSPCKCSKPQVNWVWSHGHCRDSPHPPPLQATPGSHLQAHFTCSLCWLAWKLLPI